MDDTKGHRPQLSLICGHFPYVYQLDNLLLLQKLNLLMSEILTDWPETKLIKLIDINSFGESKGLRIFLIVQKRLVCPQEFLLCEFSSTRTRLRQLVDYGYYQSLATS